MFDKSSKLLLFIALFSLNNHYASANDDRLPESPGEPMNIDTAPIGPASNAATLVHGDCVSQFNYFIKSESPRVFAYSTNDGTRQACGAHAGGSIELAREKALHRCNKKIKKNNGRALLDECRIVAEDNVQLVGLADFGVDEDAAYKRALLIGNLRGVKHFIEQGASFTTQSAEGATALFIAAAHGDEDFFFELVDRGSDIKHKLNDNTTVLFAAIKGLSPTIIRYLVDEGADVNHLPDEGYRPLHFAFGVLNDYMVALLMELNADPTLTTADGISGYDLAETWKIDLDLLKDVNLGSIDDGCTQARDAAKYGDLFRIEQLAKADIDLNIVCDTGQLSLSWADNSTKVIDLLVALGADVNAQESDGTTPLMEAARKGNLKNVKALLLHGADKSLKNKDGETAFDKINSIDEDEMKVLLAR